MEIETTRSEIEMAKKVYSLIRRGWTYGNIAKSFNHSPVYIKALYQYWTRTDPMTSLKAITAAREVKKSI